MITKLKKKWVADLVKPLVNLIYTCWVLLKEFIRRWTEGKEKYTPIESL